MIFNTIGRVLCVEGALLVLPLLVSAINQEACWLAFLVAIAACLAVGAVLLLFCSPKDTTMYTREGLIIVALCWLAISLFGSIPFVVSGEIPSFADAFFETVSGFTTTGASILTDIEALSKGILFWRSFTHWIGGMGILVFVVAILKRNTDRPIHILRAEIPGPTMDKLVPKSGDTAKILYLIYIGMTVLEIIFLLFGGMTFYESCVHAFGTAGTGGFGIKSNSLEGYSPYCQWVVAIFMFLFGINFNLYFVLLIGKAKDAFKSTELWAYVGIVVFAAFGIFCNILPTCKGAEEAIRLSFFQASSIITTTGFSTADFNLWPTFSKLILFILMFIGGCAGSTAGGLKVSRVVILVKRIRRQLRRVVHPRAVERVKNDGKTVDEETVNETGAYFALYFVILAVLFLLVGLDASNFDFETNVSAVAACFNNVGPGFGAVGPKGSYAGYSVFSKLVLSAAMLLGRLEIYPLLLVLMPSTWARKK